MKTVTLFSIILAILFAGCFKNKEAIPSITFSDKAYIKIIADNDFDSLVISTNYSNRFPLQPCLYHQINIKKKGIYRTAYKITKPEMIGIYLPQDTFFTYMVPADTLIIKVGMNSHSPDSSLVYCKINDSINAYFQRGFKHFGSYYFQSPIAFSSFNIIPESQKSYDKAVYSINAAQNERLLFLEKNKQGLPEWFVHIEQNNLIYYSAQMKLYQYFYLHDRNLLDKLPPADVSIYNPYAIFSEFYWSFLVDYFFMSYTVDNKLHGPQRMIALYKKATPKINTMLKQDVLRYFNPYLLMTLYKCSQSKEEIEIVDQFIKSHDFGLSVTEITAINQERSDVQKYFKRTTLLPGDKAPSFQLKDISGKIHNLAEFKDKIVYLHFWATWCGPCIQELPAVNQLDKRIGNKPVVIVNICLDDKTEKWKQIIEKEKLKGINLICKGNWGEVLHNSYSITGIPHYALIDRNGLLIANACQRPDKIYDELVARMKKK